MAFEVYYSESFFRALAAMIDKRPHRCKACGVVDGCRDFTKDGHRKKFPSVVRLCLIDPKGASNDAKNVGMFCTKCRKATWRAPRKLRPSELPQLFKRGDS